MPQYQIMYWKKVPAQVKVLSDSGDLSAPLAKRFQDVIDELAMRLGMLDTDDYLEGWNWGPLLEAEGGTVKVLESAVAEIEAQYPARHDELLDYFLNVLDT